ncbi:hypothetical protein ACFQBQ_17430 [Granulicella cerasi]|uniref:Uncharacterized protein n=1 Tax=Granulicella cerasi TaxID=741063 RepID=A0ABW1ZE29_9BACT|nr:hypothetical protein [Granulicella cerasi]
MSRATNHPRWSASALPKAVVKRPSAQRPNCFLSPATKLLSYGKIGVNQSMSEPSPPNTILVNTSYQVAVDTWKFQVEQYWTRSSYYVVFELALAAGIWKVFDEKHWFTSGFLSVGAILFTVLWVLNNERLNEYISYYWKRLKDVENDLKIPREYQIFHRIHDADGLGKRRYDGSYRTYGRMLPRIFFIGWLYMAVWSFQLAFHHCPCK